MLAVAEMASEPLPMYSPPFPMVGLFATSVPFIFAVIPLPADLVNLMVLVKVSLVLYGVALMADVDG